jgi:hypothetical protein
MDPKGKGMVINDKEKETLYELKDEKPPLLHQGMMTTKSPHRKRKRLTKTIILIILASLII